VSIHPVAGSTSGSRGSPEKDLLEVPTHRCQWEKVEVQCAEAVFDAPRTGQARIEQFPDGGELSGNAFCSGGGDDIRVEAVRRVAVEPDALAEFARLTLRATDRVTPYGVVLRCLLHERISQG